MTERKSSRFAYRESKGEVDRRPTRVERGRPAIALRPNGRAAAVIIV